MGLRNVIGALGLALGLVVAGASSSEAAGNTISADKWLWAYDGYPNVYDKYHQVIGESRWQDIHAHCQANNFGGVWGNQLYLWATVPYATTTGPKTGWVDARNVNHYAPGGIPDLTWCW